MQSIIKDLIKLHAQALDEGELAQFLKEAETELLKIRFKHRFFSLEYNRESFSRQTSVPQSNYLMPLWCFLYYSRHQSNHQHQEKTVLDIINSFVEKDFGLLSEADFERTRTGAMRAFNNLRFAGDKLKKWKVVVDAKKRREAVPHFIHENLYPLDEGRNDWDAFELTQQGREAWSLIEKGALDYGVIEQAKGRFPFLREDTFSKSKLYDPAVWNVVLRIRSYFGVA